MVEFAGLPGGLLGVGVQPVAVDGPGADDGLPQQVGQRAVRQRRQRLQPLQGCLPTRRASSASTEIRARTSSLRLVSWVVRVVIAGGSSAWRRAIRVWNSSGATANSVGSPPTSVSECPAGSSGRTRCPRRPWPSPCRRSAGSACRVRRRRRRRRAAAAASTSTAPARSGRRRAASSHASVEVRPRPPAGRSGRPGSGEELGQCVRRGVLASPAAAGTSRASRSTSECRIPSATARLVPWIMSASVGSAAAQLGVERVERAPGRRGRRAPGRRRRARRSRWCPRVAQAAGSASPGSRIFSTST